MSRVNKTMRGLLYPNHRTATAEALRANDGAAENSSYSEQSPRPGSPSTTDTRSRMVPQISSAQSFAVDVRAMSGGNPSRTEQAAHLIYKRATEPDSAYRGYSQPVWLNHWQWLKHGAAAPQVVGVATIPSTESPIAVYARNDVLGTHLKSKLWNWASRAWGPEISISTEPILITACDVLVLPGVERVIAYHFDSVKDRVDAAFTDDGVSWERYALDCLSDPFAFPSPDAERLRVVHHRGDLAMFLEAAGGTGEFAQWASNDLGHHFSLVETADAFGAQLSAVELPGGEGIGLIYRRQADDFPTFLRISSAFQPISDATPIVIASIEVAQLVADVDADGTLYVWGRDAQNPPSQNGDDVHCWFSTDLGESWQEFTVDGASTTYENLFYRSGDNGERLLPRAVTAARGWHAVVHSAFTSGPEEDYLGCAWGGGWGNVVAEHGESTTGGELIRQEWMMGWGWDDNERGTCWLPFSLPEAALWTQFGTVATLDATGVSVATVAATSFWGLTSAVALFDELQTSYLYEVEPLTGGDLGSEQIAASFRLADGTDDYDFSIRHTPTGFRVFDKTIGSQIGTDVSVSGRVQVAVWFDPGLSGASGFLWVWYRGPFDTRWLVAVEPLGGVIANVANDTVTPQALSQTRWGHITASSSTSSWSQFHYRTRAAASLVRQRLRSVGADNIGRAINGSPYPIPDIGADEVAPPNAVQARLSLRGGPGRTGDLFTVDPIPDYPISNIFPRLSPSEAETWRSVDLSEQIISIGMGDLSTLGSFTLGLYLGGVNFSTCHLEGWDGAAWVLLGTYAGDVGFSGLRWDRSGDSIRPAAITIRGGRLLQHGELVGGFARLGVAGQNYKITQHRTGAWTPSGDDAVKVVCTLAGNPTAGGAAASGSGMSLVARGGLLVVHLDEDTYYEHFRLRIPAAQEQPDPYYEIGVAVLGPIAVWGKQPSRGWSQRLVPNVATRSSRFGTIRTEKRGPPIREWSFSWAGQPVDLYALRNTITPDYLGSSAANKAPLTPVQDVWWTYWGLLEADILSGEYPVVGVAQVPDSSTTITDRTLMLFGSLTSPGRVTNVLGSEGEDELVRVEPLTITGTA